MIDGAPDDAFLDREPDLDVACVHDLRRIGGRGIGAAFGFGGQQMLGVLVAGVGEHLFGGALFDDFAVGHHRYRVGHVAADAQIMGDQQHRHVEFFLKVLQQLQHRRLNGDVQGRRRFVGN